MRRVPQPRPSVHRALRTVRPSSLQTRFHHLLSLPRQHSGRGSGHGRGPAWISFSVAALQNPGKSAYADIPGFPSPPAPLPLLALTAGRQRKLRTMPTGRQVARGLGRLPAASLRLAAQAGLRYSLVSFDWISPCEPYSPPLIRDFQANPGCLVQSSFRRMSQTGPWPFLRVVSVRSPNG